MDGFDRLGILSVEGNSELFLPSIFLPFGKFLKVKKSSRIKGKEIWGCCDPQIVHPMIVGAPMQYFTAALLTCLFWFSFNIDPTFATLLEIGFAGFKTDAFRFKQIALEDLWRQ